MAEKTLNTRQKQKYDTSTNWTTNNPVLLAGELGIESDTNKFKIGNGTSVWNELDYAGGGEVVLYSTTGQNTDGAMTQKATTDALPQCIEIEMNMQTGQATVAVEQFEKLLENPENYIVVNMSLTDSDGSIRTESVKFIRGSYRKAETSSYWVEHLFFNSVNTGDTEKNPYMYLILARHSIAPNDIGIGMGGEEYATISKLNEKVDKVNGMGLSTNDYTTADKNKLAGIEAGAEVNPTSLSELSEDATHRLVTDTEKSTWNAKSDFSGDYNDLTNKPTIPTNNNQLTNGAGYTKVTVNNVAQSTINFDSDPQTQIDARVKTSDLLNLVYPINSIYLSVNNTSPASLFGGSWEALAEGYALWTTTTSGEGGKTISAGLPNITGTTPMLNSLWNYVDATGFNEEFSGAIYSYIAISNGPGPTGTNKCQTRFGFDASKSNSIYGNSAIVQPPAIKIFAWKRIA